MRVTDVTTSTVVFEEEGSAQPSGLTPFDGAAAGLSAASTDVQKMGKELKDLHDQEVIDRAAADLLKEDVLPKDTANRYLKRNAANDGWELADIDISPANLIAGAGAPTAGIGNDGFYYEQLDVALGTNDIWGPKAAGAWPAQADFKSADPETGTLASLNTGTGTAPKSYSEKTLTDWLEGKKNVRNFGSYGEANAQGVQPRDTIFIIGMEKEVWARTETTGSFPFPGTGEPDANWFRVGDSEPDPQSLILDNIEVGIRSAGTDAGSNISLTFVDKDGIDYPATAWAVSLNLVEYTAGGGIIVTDKSLYGGTVGVGRNKQGFGKFYYTGENPNGLSAIRVDAATSTVTQSVTVTYQGTNYNDAFANIGEITEILYWTTSGQDKATDQAAYILELTEYNEGDVISFREPDNTDPDYGTLFNWQVLAGQTIADTEVNDTSIEAELIAIKPKLERFGIGSTSSVTVAYPGGNGVPEANKDNVYYLDETVGALPLPSANQEISVSIVQANSTDSQAIKDAAKAKVTHYRTFDTGAGFIWVESESQTQTTGNAVERTVIQANRGSVISFGDFQFRVPSSGNSSLQYRVPSGVIAVSDFITKWSNQQGGASENAFGYNLSTSWAYFRLNGALNLTLHNSYQDAMFTANGWTYRVEVIVGSSWTNNRFSFTRWRQEGVKGDAGNDGVDGIDGRSITTSHRSDGITAIGGTVYTLDHIIYEYSDSTFQDMGLLIAPASSPDVLLGAYDSTSFVTSRTFTLPDGRTWQDVLNEFKFVYFLVGGNNLFTHEQTRMIHVDDLTVANRDISLTSYQDHGTNSYHMKFRIPFTNGTTITVDNDSSNMQVQRIKVIGIK